MQKLLRHTIINSLWEAYRQTTPQMLVIENGLKQLGLHHLILDHFAIIDLPGPHTGIDTLSQFFTKIGYEIQGNDYLAEKQNDFRWLAEPNSLDLPAHQVLPQVVVADFRLQELPITVRRIIEKYANQSKPPPLADLQNPALFLHYFSGRDWPLPTISEFKTVQEYNELLAWVLVFGRKPNHFTLSVHLMDHFADLDAFHQFIENTLSLTLNTDGGAIKGGKSCGIQQGSTSGIISQIKLADGNIHIPTGFVEFVWRHPHTSSQQNPTRWGDFFTGFVANNANKVIQSLFHVA